MIDEIKSLIASDTGKDTSIVFAGTIVNAFIGGIFFIVAPRILGPAQYGLFAVVTSTGILIASLANFGIDTGILRFTNVADKVLTNKILKLALEAYLSIGILFMVLGFFLSPVIASVLNNTGLSPLLRISFIGVIFLLLTDFFIATLQSKKQFFKASLVNISSNVARLLILGFAAYFFTVNLYFLTALFFFVPLVSIAVGKFFVPLDFLKAKDHRDQFRNFFAFNSWTAGALAISSIPVDNYLLINIAGPIATGIYAAPFKILSVTLQLAGNFSRVLAPRFSSFKDNNEAINYAKKAVPIVLLMVAGLLVTSGLADPIVRLLLGKQYLDSISIFRIIAVSYAFYFADTIAVSLIVYYFGRPKVTFLITIIIMIVWALSNFILIPKYQAVGAAVAELISGVTAFILFTTYVIWQFSKRTNVQG